MLKRFLTWLFTVAICAAVVWATAYGFSPASNNVEWRLVDVPPQTSLSDVAEKLQSMGIIRSQVCFLAAARLTGEWGRLPAGQYRLSPSMGPVDIVAKLSKGEVATEWVVVPEGSTLKQIEKILEKHGLSREKRFEASLRQYVAYYRAPLDLPSPTLEGYLFPDTYKISKTMTEGAIIRMMVERFRRLVGVGLHDQIQRSTTGLSMSDTVILASLVEKEAAKDEERAHIAGVLINRLRRGMMLECDATVEYALPEHKAHLTHEDLQIDSPYNSYKHRGLPPSAICSPGLPSLRAALAPERTHDLYYVATPAGSHLFAATLAEHDKNIAKARQMQGDELSSASVTPAAANIATDSESGERTKGTRRRKL